MLDMVDDDLHEVVVAVLDDQVLYRRRVRFASAERSGGVRAASSRVPHAATQSRRPCSRDSANCSTDESPRSTARPS